jgi:hypothetical protein
VAVAVVAVEADDMNSTPNDPHSSETQHQEVPPPSQEVSMVKSGEEVEVTSCPHGHGALKPWEGHLRCWTCGWQGQATQGSKPDGQKPQPPEKLQVAGEGCLFGIFFHLLFIVFMAFLVLGMIFILPHFVIPNHSPSRWENIGAIAFPILTVFTFVTLNKFYPDGLRRGGRSSGGGSGGCGGCGGGGCGGGE